MLFFLRTLNGSLTDLLDFNNPVVCGLYLHSCDTSFKREHPYVSKHSPNVLPDLFGNIPLVDDIYCSVSRQINSINMEFRIQKRLESYKTKELLTHGFPLNLC